MPFVPWKTMVVGPPQAVDQRPDEKWREGSTGAPTAAGGASARSRSPGRGELVSSVGGSGHRMAGLVCLPLRWCCHAGAHTVPCSGGSSEMAVGFCLFVSFGPGFAPASHACCYLVPYHFFALCSSRRRVFSCTHWQPCSKGAQTCLITTTIRIPLEEMAFFLPWEFFLL